VTNDSDDTAAKASIGDVSGYADRVDAQVREVLGRVLAQRRSAGTAFAYVAGLAPGAYLVNTARGPLVDTAALPAAASRRRSSTARASGP
jgi:hypothetical protein